MLSEVLITFLITTSAGVLLKILSICFKSKCDQVDFCCLKIHRNVSIETEELPQLNQNNQNIQL